jgi:serine/threonine protein kinase
MAPEVFLHRGYAYPADLWSLGALLYELLAGKNPFVEIDTDDMKEIYDQIITSSLEFPHFMRDTAHPLMRSAKNLIAQLLDKEVPAHRLGGSFSQLRAHPFFSGFDWVKYE